jgi:hypothetical protein
VDFTICPEQIITEHIARLIEFPEALQALDFVGGPGRASPGQGDRKRLVLLGSATDERVGGTAGRRAPLSVDQLMRLLLLTLLKVKPYQCLFFSIKINWLQRYKMVSNCKIVASHAEKR